MNNTVGDCEYNILNAVTGSYGRSTRMYTTLPSVFGDKFMDSVFADFNQIMKNSRFSFDDSFPPLNLYMNSDDKACTFELALTGYKKDWLSVEVNGTNLTISADVPESDEEDSKKYIKRRIKATSFKKVYKIPEGYDTDNTEVSYADGLLTIYIPREEKVEPTTKKIKIK